MLLRRSRLADRVGSVGEAAADAAWGCPKGVPAEANPVAAGDRRAELIPAVGETGHVIARDPAHCLDVSRLRIGVGPTPPGLEDLAEFVLAPLAEQERRELAALLDPMAEAVECWLADGIERAMSRFNH